MNLDLKAVYEQSFIYAKKYVDYKNSMESDSEEGGQKKWSETTYRVFDLIKANPNISRKQLYEELNINPSAIQKHIEKLKGQNAIKRQGGAKGGHWEIIKTKGDEL